MLQCRGDFADGGDKHNSGKSTINFNIFSILRRLFPLPLILPLHNLKRVPGQFLEQLCVNP